MSFTLKTNPETISITFPQEVVTKKLIGKAKTESLYNLPAIIELKFRIESDAEYEIGGEAYKNGEEIFERLLNDKESGTVIRFSAGKRAIYCLIESMKLEIREGSDDLYIQMSMKEAENDGFKA